MFACYTVNMLDLHIYFHNLKKDNDKINNNNNNKFKNK